MRGGSDQPVEVLLGPGLQGEGERLLRVSLPGPLPLREFLLFLGLDPRNVGPVLREGRTASPEVTVLPGERLVLLPPLDGG